MAQPKSDSKSWLERLLGAVTEVREGEAGTALLLTLNVFFLLTAYYVIKPVREGLILDLDAGAQYKSYSSGAIAVLLLGAVPLYARVANMMPRNRLVVTVTLFFASHLLIFYAVDKIPIVHAYLGIPFYLWVGIFNMMVVAQFWAYANDVYTLEQGKRLFPLVGIGASVGAALGSKVANLLVVPLGVPQMLLLSAALLGVCAAFTQVVHVRERDRMAKRGKKDKKPQRDKSGAFAMVLNHPYLRHIALFTLVFTFVNSNGEYVLSVLVSDSAKEAVAAGDLLKADMGAWITAYYGDFFFYVNVVGVLLQTFVVSRLVKWGGLRLAFFALPVIAMGDWLVALALPVLMAVRIGKTMENAADYSINNTVRQMLWLPTTAEMKYKAKQAVDTFFVRMGDVSSAVLVAGMAQGLGMGVRAFAVVNLALIAVWIVLGRQIVAENERLADKEAA